MEEDKGVWMVVVVNNNSKINACTNATVPVTDLFFSFPLSLLFVRPLPEDSNHVLQIAVGLSKQLALLLIGGDNEGLKFFVMASDGEKNVSIPECYHLFIYFSNKH